MKEMSMRDDIEKRYINREILDYINYLEKKIDLLNNIITTLEQDRIKLYTICHWIQELNKKTSIELPGVFFEWFKEDDLTNSNILVEKK